MDQNDKLIIGGDFNTVLNENIDKKGGNKGQISKSRNFLKQLIEKFNLVDIWRVKNPNTQQFTWRQATLKIYCRLDFFLVSNTLQDSVLEAGMIHAFRSDHSGISIEIKCSEPEQRGRGHWKFNSKLLENDQYTDAVVTNIKKWIDEVNHYDDRMKWEWLKYKIRNFTIHFSKQNSKQKQDKIDLLTKELTILEQEIVSDENKTIIYLAKKNELENLMKEKTEGIILRAKARWHQEGENSTKYFYNLEKRNYNKKTMKKLNIDGKLRENPKEILTEQKNFYKNLYSSEKQHIDKDLETKFLKNPTLPKLTKENSISCEGKLTTSECFKALKSFGKCKSPGNDGLTAEFYLFFWTHLGEIMVKSFNTSYEKCLLTNSQRQAVITLLEKPGKDRTLLKNWRPISLLNTDYKIATKALASRLTPVLPTIIHHNQTGYVKNRNISDSIKSILDILEYTKRKQLSGMLLCLDFQKAFDSLEWNFMFKALKAFNFGDSFIKWIKLIYTDVSSCVINNGNTSEYFEVGRGVRQGDPLSAFLFIISVEILSHAIRECSDIKGIKIDKEEIKLVQFADDTTPLLSDKKSIKPLFKLLEEFAKISGLKINAEKTELFWLGNKASSRERIIGLPEPTNVIKLLGVYISYDNKLMMEKNFEKKIQDLASTFHLWSTRNLTLEGRILLAKSLGLSKFTHIISVLPIPQLYQKRIETCIFNFIWKGSKDKVKRKTIIQDYKHGGQKMLDIEATQKKISVKWVQKYLDSSIISPWKFILKEYLKNYGNIELIAYCNFDEKELEKYLPTFYVNALLNWKLFYENLNDSGKQIVWYNKEIKVQNKTLFVKEFFEKGLLTISDIFTNDAKPKPFNYWTHLGIKQEYYFRYRQIIQATFHKRKEAHTQKSNNPQLINLKGKDLDIVDIPSKTIYQFFVEMKLEKGNEMKLTKQTHEENCTDQIKKNILELPRKCTKDHKLRDLQYKILQNYLPVNKKLFKYKLRENDRCDLCNLSSETIQHLLWECTISKSLWLQFGQWWNNQNTNISFTLSMKSVLYGHFLNTDSFQSSLLNHLILITKKYIFDKKKQKTLSLNELIAIFTETKKIEYTVAKMTQKLHLYYRKWEKIDLTLRK